MISAEAGIGHMRKFFGAISAVSRITIQSQALKSNMLGDPSARVVDVYIPGVRPTPRTTATVQRSKMHRPC
jgi:hypothetical protein